MAASSPDIPLIGGGTARRWKLPWETWRRTRSNAAFLSDYVARQKPILLCLPCQARMPRRWQSRLGYRELRQMFCDGHCDYCKGFAACNLFHHELGDYTKEHDRLGAIEASIQQQRIDIRDTRRVH
jgi:hypothetical protein